MFCYDSSCVTSTSDIVSLPFQQASISVGGGYATINNSQYINFMREMNHQNHISAWRQRGPDDDLPSSPNCAKCCLCLSRRRVSVTKRRMLHRNRVPDIHPSPRCVMLILGKSCAICKIGKAAKSAAAGWGEIHIDQQLINIASI